MVDDGIAGLKNWTHSAIHCSHDITAKTRDILCKNVTRSSTYDDPAFRPSSTFRIQVRP